MEIEILVDELIPTVAPPIPSTASVYSNKSPSPNSNLLSSSPLSPSQKPNLMEEDTPIKKSTDESGWELIRELDNVENWSERTRIISKHDHQFYTDCAKEFMTNIVDEITSSNTDIHSESPDFGVHADVNPEATYTITSPMDTDMIPNPEAIYAINNPEATYTITSSTEHRQPVVVQDGEFDYMNEFSDADFQTSSSQLDVDFLEKMTLKNNPIAPSALARESLYVKFDPLVSGSPPKKGVGSHTPTVLPSLRGDNLLMLDTPPQSQLTPRSSASSSIATPNNVGNLFGSPALENELRQPSSDHLNRTPRSHTSSPSVRTLLDASPSANFPSPPNNVVQPPSQTSVDDNSELVKVLKYSEADMLQIIQQVKQSCQLEAEEQVLVVKEEYSEEIRKFQKKMERLVKELQNLRSNNAIQSSHTVKMEEEIAKLKEICTEHEETETKVLDSYEKLKEESKNIEKQRDQALTDFTSLEKSFADFHQRHIKAREAVSTLQQSEASLQQYINELESKLDHIEQMNQQLQQETMAKIQEANDVYEKLKSDHASEIAVIKANSKKMAVQISSLERQLQQKEQEKSELTQICEDLMKELGSK